MCSETDFECSEAEAEYRKEKISVEAAKKHVCSYTGCQFSFNRPWKLNRHILTHTKQRPFKCDHPGCTKDYTNKSHLDRHKCVSHSENKPVPVPLPCPYPECSKVFMNKWSLKKHCNTHKAKTVYDCPQCGISFKKYRQLKHHINVHLGVNPFICDDCKESFENEKELKLHKKKHKIYTCEFQECQQQFQTWNTLRKHIKICHATVYICDSCGRTFKNKWALTEHVFTHIPYDERDIFTCPHDNCLRFYFHQKNLEHHLKSYHQDINHKCKVENCGQTFVKRADLKKHHKQEHTEFKVSKKITPKPKRQRKERSDKGQPRKSMAAMLSGIILPHQIDKSLAQNKITHEVLEGIENLKNALLNGNIIKEEHIPCSENVDPVCVS